jgi:pimeloyl-ACP methyl ester carboxylesterase
MDGKRLATIVRTKDTLSAYLTDLDEMAVKASVLLSKDLTGHRGDSQIYWVSGDRIVVQVGTRDVLAFDADGSAITWLIDWKKEGWFKPALGRVDDPFYSPFDSSATPPIIRADPASRPTPLRRVRIIMLPAADSDFVYVEGIRGTEFDLYRIHLRTGALETVQRESVEGLLVYDRQGRARLRLSNWTIPHRWHLRVPDEKRASWVPLGAGISAPTTNAFDVSVSTMFGTRSFPLGFDEDPNILYIASNAGRDTYGIYGLDLHKGSRTSFALQHPSFDLASPVGGLAGAFSATNEPTLVFDRATRALAGVRYLGLRSTALWVDPSIAAVQRRLEGMNPTANVQIEHWDARRTRFLVQLFSRSDPGFYAIFEPSTERLQRVFSRGPKEPPVQPMRTVPWEFMSTEGVPLTGEITMPGRPRAIPVPIVVFFRQSEWSRQFMRYNPQVASLAHLGFAVLEVNHRGLAGFGEKHWIAGRLKSDAAATEDAMAAVDHLAPRLRLDNRKVVFFGTALGGFFALRAAQILPERVAAVATINPVANLPDWIVPPVELHFSSRLLYASRSWFFGPDAKTRRQHSPLHHEPAAMAPTLIVSTYEPSTSLHTDFEALRRKAISAGGVLHVERVVRDNDPSLQSARAMTAIAAFLERTFPELPVTTGGKGPVKSPQ